MDHQFDRQREIKRAGRRLSRLGLAIARLRRAVRGLLWSLLRLISGFKRAVDFCLAALLLTLVAPIFACLWMLSSDSSKMLKRTPRSGRWGKVFFEYAFDPDGFAEVDGLLRVGLRRLPVLLNILAGDMAFVGPRAVAPEELSPRDRLARRRYAVRPGLICLWWLRQRANIPFDGEASADADYVKTPSLRNDLGIVLRALPAVFMGTSPVVADDRVDVLGIEIDNLTMNEALTAILAAMQRPEPSQVCFVNADCANIACRDAAYRQVLEGAALTLADGIGMRLAGKILSRPIRENVNGTDLFPRLSSSLSQSGQGLYLLGGRPGIAERVAEWLQEHYPQLVVSGVHHGYFSAAEEPEVIAEIARSGAAVLLVAFGAPRQDQWLARNLSATGVRVAMGVGGLFDFYSGNVPRAPLWMREVNAEWLYRFWQEPRRMWKRYFLGNGVFITRVIRQSWRRGWSQDHD